MTDLLVLGLLVVGLWLAFKVVGLLFKLACWAVVIGAIYWLAAPSFGLPLPG